jgi:hypothetical protein
VVPVVVVVSDGGVVVGAVSVVVVVSDGALGVVAVFVSGVVGVGVGLPATPLDGVVSTSGDATSVLLA